MRDRVPMYPGRVQLTPVPGQANTYDLIRKDEPIVAGSAYSKGNVLPDTVCNALGIDRVTSEPKDAFTRLAKKCDAASGMYDGNNASSRVISLGYMPRVVLIFTQGGSAGPASNRSGAAMALQGFPAVIEGYDAISIDAGGFSVYQNAAWAVHFNQSGIRYYYVTLRW